MKITSIIFFKIFAFTTSKKSIQVLFFLSMAWNLKIKQENKILARWSKSSTEPFVKTSFLGTSDFIDFFTGRWKAISWEGLIGDKISPLSTYSK
jgi:hypothetical protein